MKQYINKRLWYEGVGMDDVKKVVVNWILYIVRVMNYDNIFKNLKVVRFNVLIFCQDFWYIKLLLRVRSQ